jgi:hypothetical protein
MILSRKDIKSIKDKIIISSKKDNRIRRGNNNYIAIVGCGLFYELLARRAVYGIPKLINYQTEMHCQICCKCMANLQNMVKMWCRCMVNTNAKHYQANALSNANALSALSNANEWSICGWFGRLGVRAPTLRY